MAVAPTESLPVLPDGLQAADPFQSPIPVQTLTQAQVHVSTTASASALDDAASVSPVMTTATGAPASFDVSEASAAQSQDLSLPVRNDEINGSRHFDPNKTNVKRLGVLHELELRKSPASGFGFSLTTRDVPVGGNSPIYVKHIVPGGPAQVEGQLRVGDRLLEVCFPKCTRDGTCSCFLSLCLLAPRVCLRVRRAFSFALVQ